MEVTTGSDEFHLALLWGTSLSIVRTLSPRALIRPVYKGRGWGQLNDSQRTRLGGGEQALETIANKKEQEGEEG